MTGLVLETRDLRCVYPQTDNGSPALAGVDLQVREGDFIAVSGPNGAGKSTLLGCISGVIPRLTPAQVNGSTLVRGQPIEGYAMPDLVRNIGVVLEDPDAQLFGATVRQFLAFGLELAGQSCEEMTRQIGQVAEKLGVSELLERRCQTLSGGEKQRVVVASMLLMRPSIVVLDEPTSQLDPRGTRDLFATLRLLNRELGLTIIVSSHNLGELAEMATHLVVLEQGRVKAQGPFAEVLGLPLQRLLRYPQATELFILCRDQALTSEAVPPTTIREGARFLLRVSKKEMAQS